MRGCVWSSVEAFMQLLLGAAFRAEHERHRASRSARKLAASHNRRVGCEHGDRAPPHAYPGNANYGSRLIRVRGPRQRWVRASSANAAGPSACIRLLRSHTALDDLACPYVCMRIA
jgi:hypothetical protein